MKPTSPPIVLPPAVAAFSARLPAWPGSALLSAALNLGLAPQLPADVAERLRDKRLRIQVRDAGLSFDFSWTGTAFVPRPRFAETDLCISASAHDFWLLAQRRQDPDTLFFGRRLSTQGDTELGLMVKNTLDALELPVLDPQAWAPRQALGRLVALAPQLPLPPGLRAWVGAVPPRGGSRSA
jgi:predicted lipid carrier protein YhbT